MMKNKFAVLFVVALLFVFSSTLLRAQYENGSLVGTIRDATGKVISGANVAITNVATGVSSQGKTNGSGDYDFPSVRVGSYNIQAGAQGFADAIAKNISVVVGGRQRIDLTLKVGSAETTVEVTDVALQLETDQSQRDFTVTGYQTEAFPLVSRNFSDLLGLVNGSAQAPTAATTTNVTSLVRAGAYNINGQRSMFNNFLLDGMDNNAYGESNQGFDNQIIPIPPDSVAQFQVITNNMNAEYGRSSAATINVASKGGTNQFHATIYEFNRNTALNAPGFFKVANSASGFKKPLFNRNQFGMNLGGPISPNHVFFFGDYEGFRQKLTPLVFLSLPTLTELGLSPTRTSLGGPVLSVAVTNHVNGKTYAAGSVIPTSDLDTVANEVIGFFQQLPNLPASGSVANDYPTEAPFTDNSDKGDLRFDWQQNDKSSWFLRLAERKETGINYQTITANPSVFNPLDGQTNGRQKILSQQIAIGYNHLFGTDKILDARFGLSETDAGKYTLSIGQPLGAIGIPGLTQVPNFLAGGLPSISISNGFTAFGRQSTNPQWQNPALMDAKVNYSWVRGHHSLKFGYEYEHVWMDVQDSNPLYGGFSFTGGYSGSGQDGSWADFLFGNSNGYSLASYFVAHLRQAMDNVYVQDDWKVSSKFTANIGLRWEFATPYWERDNNLSNFDPASQTVLTITKNLPATLPAGITPVHPGGLYGKTLVNPDYADFAPRLGFAYAATPSISIRGGFGMSYVHYTRAGSGDILAINAPMSQFTAVSQCPVGATCPANLTALAPCSTTSSVNCYSTLAQGFPTGLATTFNKNTANITWVPKNTKDSYVESYFLSVQKQLAKNTLLDLAYVGNHGIKLQGFLNGNQKNPNNSYARTFANWPSDITEALNEFWSNYNALQVRYEQRFVEGLTLSNNFTWSHALDNASASLEGNTPSPQDGNNIAADYGQSDYNIPTQNVTSLVYELPFGRGRRFLGDSNKVMNALVGDWQISAVNTAHAGIPFNLTYTPGTGLTPVSPQISATYRGANEYRLNVVPGKSLIQNTRLANGAIQYVNLSAFTAPASGASPFGNARRNPGRTPGFEQLDLAINKKVSTPLERLKLEFRGEAYNLLNRTNYYLPASGLSAKAGLAPTSGGTITSTFEPRILQLGVKILY